MLNRPADPDADKANTGRTDALPVRDFEVEVPFAPGSVTRARVTGPEQAPVVVVLGGISANRFVCGFPDGRRGWWPGLVGVGDAIDPRDFRVLGLDFAADESGKTAPSTNDQASVVTAALDQLGVERAHGFVGASYGGMVGLALAQQFPERLARLVVISAGAEPHAAGTAWRDLQRRVVALGIEAGTAAEALTIARGMGMLSYRTAPEFGQRFEGGLDSQDPLGRTEPGEYLRARGEAFQAVMTPQRFLSLSGSIDRHRVEPEKISTPTLVIGAETDQLVLPSQMAALTERLAGPAEVHLLESLYGHDMFLKEAGRIGTLIKPFLDARPHDQEA
ncbi:MAG: alpha/beta fold hydrolase [Alphaproteobacteria bacterium]|nr:alpha/beta fold hydrolase [Alphaproteobacteria bacterium]